MIVLVAKYLYDVISLLHVFTFPNFNRASMVVDLTIFVVPVVFFCKNETKKLKIPQSVHVCVDQDLNKGKQEVEYEPHVNHLNIGSFGQVVGDVDEHGGQHKHCFEKELI